MANGTDPTTTATTDIVTPSADDQQQWQQFNTLIDSTGTSLTNVGNIGHTITNVFNSLGGQISTLGNSFNSLSGMTDDTAAKFGLITTSVIGATEAFKNLAGVDTTRLVTFKGQLKDLLDIVREGPGTQLAARAISDIIGEMTSLGASSDITKKAFAELKTGVTTMAAAFLNSADNIVRLQNSFMQMTIQGSGSNALFRNISETIKGVGTDFNNINDVTSRYTAVLNNATRALGGNQELASQYMAEINRMPGGLKALLTQTELAGNKTDLLTASMHYAVGAGRDQKSVFDDMNKAMTEYSLTGGDALRFSARMTEVADTLGAQVRDVQGALTESADAFKMFVSDGANAANMTQGMADAMRNYVGELTSVGIPAQNAIQMFRNYTSVMKDMNLGQQAFVSTMTGGPGGLRGAFQMDQLVRQGNFEEIRRKVEQTIRRMTGPLVSLDEASKSEGAAAQYTRQIQLLQSGPLGGLAKTRPEAEALLQAMKEGKKIPTTGKTAEQSLNETVARGTKWQEGTYTEVSKAVGILRERQVQAGTINLRTVRGLTGATGMLGGGMGGAGAGISPAIQERIRAAQRVATTGGTGADVFKELGESIGNLPASVKEAMNTLRDAVSSGKRETITQANQRVTEAVQGAVSRQNVSLGAFSQIEDYAPAGRQLGRNVTTGGGGGTTTGGHTAGKTALTPTQLGGGQSSGQPIPVVLASGSAISVNFTGVCPHCGKGVHTTEVAHTVAPQALGGFGAGF
jgi:hypothetical protein